MKEKLFEISCSDFPYAKTPEALEQVLIELRAKYEVTPEEFRVGKLSELYVCFDLPFPVIAKFVGSINGNEIVEIKSGNRMGRFIRGNPLVVSTSSDPFYFCIDIVPHTEKGQYVDSFTDRGICWVEQGRKKASAYLVLREYWDRSWEYGDIAKLIKRARKRVIKLIEKALDSKVEIPPKKQ